MSNFVRWKPFPFLIMITINYDDIIVIVSYDPGAGDQAATPHSTVRYYRGTKEGTQAIEEYRK